MKKYFFTTILLSIATMTMAQNLTGNWVGKCRKWKNDSNYFFMSMNLKDKVGTVTGTSKISYEKEPWYCVKKLTGSTDELGLNFKDGAFITHHHEQGAYWLELSGRLKYDKHKDMLYGYVTAYDRFFDSFYPRHDYIELYRQKLIVSK